MNIADIRGVDNIRDIRRKMGLRPMLGDSKIYLLDEVHMLTKDAQNALLKMLEDTPDHVWFILCTTDPHKLIKTIRTRCTEIALKPIGGPDLSSLIMSTVASEEKKITGDVIQKLVENSDGSARKALVLLESILDIDDEQSRLDAIDKMSQEKQIIDLCRLLLNPKSQWADIASILKDLEGEEPENIRRCILGYMRAVLLKSSMPRAYQCLGAFERNFFDSGNAGLAMACYEVMGR
jgi:DNA polymerase-3 subunit gamma/tau